MFQYAEFNTATCEINLLRGRTLIDPDTSRDEQASRCKVTAVSKYVLRIRRGESPHSWNGISARASLRETGTLRNINILAGEAHWRQPKCPDGASADQVPADYRERRNHPCADCRCRVSHRRTNGAKESDRADELRGAGRAGRKRTTRAAASAATSFLLPPPPPLHWSVRD